jgi:hypothetical protein
MFNTTSPILSETLSNHNTIHFRICNGTAFHAGMTLADGTTDRRETPESVIEILLRYMHNGTPLRIFLGGPDGRSWLEECDIAGTVGRSSGRIKIPLLVGPGQAGGGALLDQCIVRIDSRRGTLWQHSNFHLPTMEFRTGEILDLAYEVWIEGVVQRRFFTADEREHWRQLIAGERFPNPALEPHAFGIDPERN